MAMNPKYNVYNAAGSTTVNLKPTQSVLRAVYVSVTNSGDKIYFCDHATAANNTQFFVEANNAVQMQYVNKTFLNGLTLTFVGTTAHYLVVYE